MTYRLNTKWGGVKKDFYFQTFAITCYGNKMLALIEPLKIKDKMKPLALSDKNKLIG
jgi:hypothetical protein